MPMPLVREMREKIIYHKENGEKNIEIAKWLRINEKSVRRIWKVYKEKKTIESKPHKKGRKPAFDNKMMNNITDRIIEQPDITLEELVSEFELRISISALSRKLIKENLTFKKRRFMRKTNSVKMLSTCVRSG